MNPTGHNHSPEVGFLFDLDGVLVDTARFHFQAWRRLAQTLGTDFTHDQNEQLKGVSRKESLQKILDWGGISLSEKEMAAYMQKKNEWYLEFVRTMTPADILPGAREFLEGARLKGVGLALGSASKNAVLILEQLKILDLLDAVIDGTKTSRSKPDPQVFQLGASALGVPPHRCVVFEDAISGVEAALAGGMHVVGIGDSEVLSKADIVKESLADITVEDAILLL